MFICIHTTHMYMHDVKCLFLCACQSFAQIYFCYCCLACLHRVMAMLLEHYVYFRVLLQCKYLPLWIHIRCRVLFVFSYDLEFAPAKEQRNLKTRAEKRKQERKIEEKKNHFETRKVEKHHKPCTVPYRCAHSE